MRKQWMGCIWGVAMVLVLAACEPIDQTSKVAAGIAKKTVDNTRSYWADLFAHRDYSPQQPQTRYCYQMQSDVVCYDNAQNGLTSKLVGYQEADMVGWFQPGGGSTGASGGAPVSLRANRQAIASGASGSSTSYTASNATSNVVEVQGLGEIKSGNLAPVKK